EDLVDVAAGQVEREGGRRGSGEPVGDRVDAVQGHDVAGGDRPVHRVGAGRLDADDTRGRLRFVDVEGDAADQSAAADGNEDRVDGFQAGENLESDGPLSGDDLRIVVGVDEGRSSFLLRRERFEVGLAVVAPGGHDARAE